VISRRGFSASFEALLRIHLVTWRYCEVFQAVTKKKVSGITCPVLQILDHYSLGVKRQNLLRATFFGCAVWNPMSNFEQLIPFVNENDCNGASCGNFCANKFSSAQMKCPNQSRTNAFLTSTNINILRGVKYAPKAPNADASCARGLSPRRGNAALKPMNPPPSLFTPCFCELPPGATSSPKTFHTNRAWWQVRDTGCKQFCLTN
jgi:hypothetical protein